MAYDITDSEIKARVDLPSLLLKHDYEQDPKEKDKWLKFRGYGEVLLVTQAPSGDWTYRNVHDDADKGNVVTWLMTRMESGIVRPVPVPVPVKSDDGSLVPERTLIQRKNDYFIDYLNKPRTERQHRPSSTPSRSHEAPPSESFKDILAQFQSLRYLNSNNPNHTHYLEGRGLSRATLQDPRFDDRIRIREYTVQREGMPPKTYYHTGFPTYHKGDIVGLELKSENFKGQAPGSQATNSLWLSDVPAGAKRPTELAVTESVLDALSHAQLHASDSTVYASTSGTLTDGKIAELKRICGEERIPVIKAAFDNDSAGHYFDTKLLAGLASEQNAMTVRQEQASPVPNALDPAGRASGWEQKQLELTPGLPPPEARSTVAVIEITASDAASVANVRALNQQLKTFNEQVAQQYYHRQSADGAPPMTGQQLRESGRLRVTNADGSPAMPPALYDALIKSSRVEGTANTYQFRVPLNPEALTAFNQAVRAHLQLEVKVEIAKSQSKDWNEDLTKQQGQQGLRTSPKPSLVRPTPSAEPGPRPAPPVLKSQVTAQAPVPVQQKPRPIKRGRRV